MITLRFFAVEDADAFSPPATRFGLVTPIGKTRQPDGSLTLDGGVSTVTLADEHTISDLAFLRGEVLGCRIKVADSNTARLLDLPFEAHKKAETLPPPAVKESK